MNALLAPLADLVESSKDNNTINEGQYLELWNALKKIYEHAPQPAQPLTNVVDDLTMDAINELNGAFHAPLIHHNQQIDLSELRPLVKAQFLTEQHREIYTSPSTFPVAYPMVNGVPQTSVSAIGCRYDVLMWMNGLYKRHLDGETINVSEFDIDMAVLFNRQLEDNVEYQRIKYDVRHNQYSPICDVIEGHYGRYDDGFREWILTYPKFRGEILQTHFVNRRFMAHAIEAIQTDNEWAFWAMLERQNVGHLANMPYLTYSNKTDATRGCERIKWDRVKQRYVKNGVENKERLHPIKMRVEIPNGVSVEFKAFTSLIRFGRASVVPHLLFAFYTLFCAGQVNEGLLSHIQFAITEREEYSMDVSGITSATRNTNREYTYSYGTHTTGYYRAITTYEHILNK